MIVHLKHHVIITLHFYAFFVYFLVAAKSDMDWRVVAFVLLLCNLFFSPWNRVEGYDRLPLEDDAKLEEELSLLNKPPVKTFHVRQFLLNIIKL